MSIIIRGNCYLLLFMDDSNELIFILLQQEKPGDNETTEDTAGSEVTKDEKQKEDTDAQEEPVEEKLNPKAMKMSGLKVALTARNLPTKGE